MTAVLAVRDATRRYGATIALSGVSIDLLPGQIHALVGENGAGKSTLIGLLSGVSRPDEGVVEVDGRAVTFTGPADARAQGVGTVFQELSLVPGLSVAENIFAGRPPTRFRMVDRRASAAAAVRLLGAFGTGIPVGAPVGTLPAGARQIVEIAKALAVGARVLILDEPTSALNADEKTRLFALLGDLRSRGLALLYVSHHLDEVLALADRITVLRDGRLVWTRENTGLDESRLVHAMVGRDLTASRPAARGSGDVLLTLDGVSAPGRLEAVSLSVAAGEIVAVAGLGGSGREAVGPVAAGLERPSRGKMVLFGKPHPGALADAMRAGLGYIPDDRKTAGLFLDRSIADNVVAADLPSVTRSGLVSSAAVATAGRDAIRDFAVRAAGPAQRISQLSGGNQQKVLMAKWLRRNPKLLVVDEPTRGVDVGSKQEVHDMLRALAGRGAGVLVGSSDLPEILMIADRIVVLHRGRVAGVLAAADADEHRVVALASGLGQPLAEAS